MQHDSQETLSLILDGLHEDLNRIKDKVYSEAIKSLNPETALLYSWDAHLKRNQSIIVDLMHGLFKSIIHCPTCKQTAVSGEPFCVIPLPIPTKESLSFSMYYIPYGAHELPVRLDMDLGKVETVASIKKRISEIMNIDKDDFIVAASGYDLKKVFDENATAGEMKAVVNSYTQATHIMLYQLKPDEKLDSNSTLPLMIGFENESTGNIDHISYARVLFINTKVSASELYAEVIAYFWRYVVDIYKATYNKTILSEADTPDKFIERLLAESNAPSDIKVESVLAPYFGLFVVSKNSEISALQHSKEILIKDINATSLEMVWSRKGRAIISQYINQYKELETPHSATLAKTEKYVTLNDCFTSFVIPEILDEDNKWYCPNCKIHVKGTKTTIIYKTPRILIIALKRFKNFASGQKNKDLVNFPLTEFDIGNYVGVPSTGGKQSTKYSLYAVVNHYGNLGGGHYTAFAKNAINEKWYLFDDSWVKEVKAEDVVTAAAYVLFYRREDTIPTKVDYEYIKLRPQKS